MRENSIFVILFVLFLSLSTKGVESASPGIEKSQQNCSYLIEVETTCAADAETTDHVSVRFSDSAGNSIIKKHLKNPKLVHANIGVKKPYIGFGRCAIDVFEASGACMSGNVCSLYLKRVGSDGWRPGWVKVLHQQDGGSAVPVSYTFYFRTFVPENVWYGFSYCHSHGGVATSHAASLDEDLHE